MIVLKFGGTSVANAQRVQLAGGNHFETRRGDRERVVLVWRMFHRRNLSLYQEPS